MRTRKTTRSLTGALHIPLAALFSVLTVTAAHADILVTTSNVNGALPGSSVDVTFNFDFGSAASGGTSVTSFGYELVFDPTLLTLAGESVSGQFTPFGSDANLETGFYSVAPSADALGQHDTATWYALDSNFNALPPLDLSGSTSVTYLFNLSAGAAGGTSTGITASIDSYSDSSFNTYQSNFYCQTEGNSCLDNNGFISSGSSNLNATAMLNVTAPATSVPEPSTASLALAGGLGLAAARVLLLFRRRQRETKTP